MKLNVRMKEQDIRCRVRMTDTSFMLPLRIKDVQTITRTDAERYTGEYTVYSTFEDQVLPTANRYCTDNITVNAIAVSTVSNPFGGNTVYIGVN